MSLVSLLIVSFAVMVIFGALAAYVDERSSDPYDSAFVAIPAIIAGAVLIGTLCFGAFRAIWRSL